LEDGAHVVGVEAVRVQFLQPQPRHHAEDESGPVGRGERERRRVEGLGVAAAGRVDGVAGRDRDGARRRR